MKTDSLISMNLKPNTIEGCWALVEKLFEINTLQMQETDKLKSEIEKLKEKNNTNSNNSSLPPSKSFKKKKTPKIPKKGAKKQGAQIGHKGHERRLFDSQKADEVIPCYPPENCTCGGKVQNISQASRKQLLDLPEPKFTLIEYQVYAGRCSCCHKKTAWNTAKWDQQSLVWCASTCFDGFIANKIQAEYPPGSAVNAGRLWDADQ